MRPGESLPDNTPQEKSRLPELSHEAKLGLGRVVIGELGLGEYADNLVTVGEKVMPAHALLTDEKCEAHTLPMIMEYRQRQLELQQAQEAFNTIQADLHTGFRHMLNLGPEQEQS